MRVLRGVEMLTDAEKIYKMAEEEGEEFTLALIACALKLKALRSPAECETLLP